MNRRELLQFGATGALVGLMPRIALAESGRIDVYITGDSNIINFWNNIIKPAFEAAHSGYRLNVVSARNNIAPIVDRALAALGSSTDPQVNLFDENDPNLPAGAIEKGLWVDFAKAGLENYDKINPVTKESDYGLPYRGTQVVLAFDTTRLALADAPKTWDELTAWIKANPGQFIYNRPDTGGSGGNFVRRAIHEANGRDPSIFRIDNYTPGESDALLAKGFELLKDIAPSVYGPGSYTADNMQSIQLLAQGVVTMAPVWSDMALAAVNQGVLPETTGFIQLTDLAFAGGFADMTVPSNAAHLDLTMKLCDLVLSPEIQAKVVTEIGAFPAIEWKYLPEALSAKYASLQPASIPVFPGGPWVSAISDGWFRTVAPHVQR
ncbi:extracellular solute-binding protein [Paracoccus aminophilus]|uniref:Spermidine/putrescine-binding periplasmic protein n=1 Tax=Paracoccus aminophilus JCM 7686 TaxID=1367847 RepID=S5XTT0_PARAH|nr:extracellular solute-binding protein [Paracoccus aminophilus]AGT08562.1 spermidine/putrescine-binding periplasmic protein [Paracoccus aminophilus JCM 7686]